jgi:Fe(3+) dicitrate transport protein
MTELLTRVLDAIVKGFVAADTRVYTPYLLGALALTLYVWFRRVRGRRSLLSFLFPRSVWLHRSALLDYRMLLVRTLLDVTVLAGAMVSVVAVGKATARWLWHNVGILPSHDASPVLVVALFSVGAFVAEDCARYWLHRLSHRVPALWELHKVHHSAEVLTPFTVYRTHPMEGVLMTSGAALAIGLVAGLVMWLFPGGLRAWEISGVYALQFVWNAAGANLRHSQVWLSYGPWLERVLISPAQHQIHHSDDVRHHDKNFGSALALWDWCFGSLYVTRGREKLRYGLPPDQQNHGDSVLSMLVHPVVRALSPRKTKMSKWPWIVRAAGMLVLCITGVSLARAQAEPTESADAGAPSAPEDASTPAEDAQAPDADEPAATSEPPPPLPAPAPVSPTPSASLPAPVPAPPPEVEVTVVGSPIARTAGSAHVVRAKQLERYEYDDVHQVLQGVPGVYVRGEDGMGLRPNIGLRGVNPDRSKKVTLMEDGVLLGPAPYSAPAAYYFPLITRMSQLRVIKGPGSVSYGPQTVGGAIDVITHPIPSQAAGQLDLGFGQYMYNKADGRFGTSDGQVGFLVQGTHVGTDGWKELPNDADTGFYRNEYLFKGSYAFDAGRVPNEVKLKLTYSDELSNETYLGLTDADFRESPLQRYAASSLDRMRNHRIAGVVTHVVEPSEALSITTDVYRHDYYRIWRKANHFRGADLFDVLTDPETPRHQLFYSVLTGETDSATPQETLFIGPNEREYVSEGVQTKLRVEGQTGPLAHRGEVGVRLHYDRIERRHSEDGYLIAGGELFPEGSATTTTAFNEAYSYALAAHASDAVSWQALTVTPGVRVEAIRSGFEDRITGDDSTRWAFALVPGVGAFYALTPELGVLAGVYRGFSPPAPGSDDRIDPELSINYEVGGRFTKGPARAELIGFYNAYTNLTDVCTFSSGCDDAMLDQQFDAGSARIFGLEAFADYEVSLPKRFKLPLSAAYTITQAQFLRGFTSDDPIFGEVEPGDELPYVPRHQLSTSLGLEHPWAGGNVSLTYVSSMREESGSGDVDDGLHTDEQLGIDVSLKGRPADWAEVYLNVRNLLDSHDIVSHRPYGARPNAPRWVQVGTKLTF